MVELLGLNVVPVPKRETRNGSKEENEEMGDVGVNSSEVREAAS